ncbi:hypothetical protein WR25_09917 [Diploscapter pachys]|uniref:P-type phospholipid transporter n=1 Tax=Diploscapter pachys TaxID=2018661 RepID=A0A2A2JYU6_9BILA|nr:hypothetical protein WR25_09917 [Diploscapter pachys]
MSFIPLIIVLLVTLIKDGIEDLRRWSRDKKINRQKCRIWNGATNSYEDSKWDQILVGDFIRIENDELIPADALIIRSSKESGICFVETSNLDGESNLKRRCVLSRYEKFSKSDQFSPSEFKDSVICETPDKSIYTIHAKIEYEFGYETKVMLNSHRAPRKVSKIERQTNLYIVISIVILVIMVVCGAVPYGFWIKNHPIEKTPFVVRNAPKPLAAGFLSIGSFIICYQVIVPIALYITIEIVKGLQIRLIEHDLEMYDEETDQPIDCRSLSIPEELGQVTHIMSDKTGTLTENVMIAKKIGFEGISYNFESDTLKHELENCEMNHGDLIHNFILNILLNNSVILHDGNYEAESPDELALLNALASLGYSMAVQEIDSTTVSFPNGQLMKIRKIMTLPFDSQRKRMSVIIDSDPDGFLMLTKGADSAIMNRLVDDNTAITKTIQSHINQYANEGLRVLCFGVKKISKLELDDFLVKKNNIENNWSHERERLLSELFDDFEKGFNLLGVTGIEDRLQDGVKDALSDLRKAGIQIWIITGDKLETAENIAHSCGLFDADLQTIRIEREIDFENVPKWQNFSCNVILSPEALRALVNGEQSSVNFLLSKSHQSVLCYRMTPSEKASVVSAVKKYSKGTVLAIGDGNNDVPMLQAAHVGIGVIGKEGMQSKLYTVWLFFINVADGIWQAACVFFICYFTLHDSFMNLWFLGYYLATGMLLANIGHLALEVRYWHLPLVLQFLFFLVLHFTYFGLYCRFVEPDRLAILGWVKDTPTSVFSDAMSHFNFYAVMSIILITALMPRRNASERWYGAAIFPYCPTFKFIETSGQYHSPMEARLRNELWTPDITFINADDVHRDKQSIAISMSSGGMILHSEKLSQTVPCKTQVSKYPFGNTTCVLQWAGGHSSNGIPMLYSWDSGVENEAAIKVSEQVGDLVLRGVIANSTSARIHGTDAEILQLIFQFKLETKKILLLFFIPTLTFMLIAWLSLLLGPMAITRSIIVTTSLLMLLLHYNTNSASLPATNGITSIDVWKLFSIIFVALIYGEIVLVTLMASMGRSRRMQKMCCCGSRRKGKYEIEPVYEEMNDLRNRRTRRTCGCCRYSALFVDFSTFWTLGIVLCLFCLIIRQRAVTEPTGYEVIKDSIKFNDTALNAKIKNKDQTLRLTVAILKDSTARILIDEDEGALRPRYQPLDALKNPEPEQTKFKKTKEEAKATKILTEDGHRIVVNHSPFRVDVFSKDILVASINSQQLLKVEPYKKKVTLTDRENGYWEETFKDFKDSKPYG